MKEKQPQEKYELVYNNTKHLLNDTMTEYEKVRIIGDIVQIIGECENSGEDFVAFTDILYKHLAPDHTENVITVVPTHQTPEVVYAEPILQGPKSLNDHIYAEPANLSRKQTMMPLLLANNYSSPLDDNPSNTNEYSEPITHAVKTSK